MSKIKVLFLVFAFTFSIVAISNADQTVGVNIADSSPFHTANGCINFSAPEAIGKIFVACKGALPTAITLIFNSPTPNVTGVSGDLVLNGQNYVIADSNYYDNVYEDSFLTPIPTGTSLCVNAKWKPPVAKDPPNTCNLTFVLVP